MKTDESESVWHKENDGLVKSKESKSLVKNLFITKMNWLKVWTMFDCYYNS